MVVWQSYYCRDAAIGDKSFNNAVTRLITLSSRGVSGPDPGPPHLRHGGGGGGASLPEIM